MPAGPEDASDIGPHPVPGALARPRRYAVHPNAKRTSTRYPTLVFQYLVWLK